MPKKRNKDPKFQAEMRKLSCLLCGSPPPSTCSHIKTRGSGGGDEYYNIVPKCAPCHRFWEDNKRECLEKYPHFADHLEQLGWKWEFHNNRFIMYR